MAKETILVIDDERNIIELARLEDAGGDRSCRVFALVSRRIKAVSQQITGYVADQDNERNVERAD